MRGDTQGEASKKVEFRDTVPMEARLRGLLSKCGVEGGNVTALIRGGSTRARVVAEEGKVLGGLGTGFVVDNLVLRYSNPARLVVKPMLSSFFLL